MFDSLSFYSNQDEGGIIVFGVDESSDYSLCGVYDAQDLQKKVTEQCPVQFSSLGRWWGNDPKQKKQPEIDIMGEQDKNTALFCECMWTNEKVDLGVFEALKERAELFSYKNRYLYLFSKSGFTKGCVDNANEMGNVTLVRYKDMQKAKTVYP